MENSLSSASPAEPDHRADKPGTTEPLAPAATEDSPTERSPRWEKELRREQAHLDMAFAHLDASRQRDQNYLRTVMLDDDPEPETRVAREIEYHRLQGNLDRYRTAEVGLVFGRIDIDDEEPDNPISESGPGAQVDRRYIGRIGLSDAEDNYRSIIMDWRADGARPFYLATTAHPEGVNLRRHLRTRGRTVRDFDDEWLKNSDLHEDTVVTAEGVGGETVLREVLDQARTGFMHGIVETIQREQDVIIRDSTRGTMVVQGGPGTGKTAVALHRVAWLLYTYRNQLAKTGVLIIGPNTTFLDYISRVLPSLGETGVVLSTIGDLYPGIEASAESEPLITQEVKGSIEMVEILKQAVRAYQIVPDEDVVVDIDGVDLHVTPAMIKAARGRARRTRRPHNEARALFREALLESLAAALADVIGADPLGGANLLSITDIADLRSELGTDARVADIIDELWPALDPVQVLQDLLTSEDAIAIAAAEYDEETRAALLRDEDRPFTETDAPLADELAELILPTDKELTGSDDWDAEVSDAQAALDTLSSSASQDLDDGFEAEILSAYDVIDAEALAERHRERDTCTTAERAKADRNWAYGHVIVDEAQELSAMAWRMIRRRSPNGWMTLVGDVAQTGSPAGSETWMDALEPVIGTRWRLHELSVNYRTPQEIMDVAAPLLAHIAPNLEAPKSIRSVGRTPQRFPSIADALSAIATSLADGRLGAVIAPTERVAEVAAEVEASSDDAHSAPAVYDVSHLKGLEFDEVIVVDPDAIVAASPQGLQDLYVALTRATQGLSVVAAEPSEYLAVLED